MKKNVLLRFIILSTVILYLGACGSTSYNPPPEEPKEDQPLGIPDDSLADNDPVPADGILESVTWNLNWYGDKMYGADDEYGGPNGPFDEFLQTKNILKVADSLRADLYAVQEVYSNKALQDIVENMSGYRGFTADHIDWIQQTGFIYNTNTIDSLDTGAITEGQDSNDWAGRLPLYFNFMYNFDGKKYEFYAVDIHAKAFDDQSSYERRRDAAQSLYNYLKNEKPGARIIFLGDYNDDVDESIYEEDGKAVESPYQPFVTDSDNFKVVSGALSSEGNSSTVDYPDMIDHITISNEIFNNYIDGSVAVFKFDDDFISNYGNTTSDHYPVWAKYDLTGSN